MTEHGHIHPLTSTMSEIVSIFSELGFEVAEGPEIESEFYNFDALNMPADHPARDMQDTFWVIPLSKRQCLRTHMTSVDVGRFLETHKNDLPARVIAPGKVFRNEATDSTHEAQFFQIDGVYVDASVSLGDLMGTLEYCFKKLLGDDVKIRFRPSFFPFVEPGVEVDIEFRGKWLEVMGAGMIHPNVFKTVGVDTSKWRGFAFGGGIDRLVMIKYDIPDVRYFYNGDLRLVNQF
ncbi:MAG TPA: phenylalanine--tRNA ligase subunit alpha [Candidatus Paceibacterota bacterium]